MSQVQIGLVGLPETTETGETKEERRRRLNTDYARRWREKNRGKVRARNQEQYQKNRDARLAYMAAWRARNREHIAEAGRAYRAANPDKIQRNRERWTAANRQKLRDYKNQWYKNNYSKFRAGQKEWRRTLRIQVIEVYGGPICKCCYQRKDYEFLAIDHIHHGRGNPAPRIERGADFYVKLRKAGFPPGYQVLCHDCNAAKGYYGVCPHTEMQTPIDAYFQSRPLISSSQSFATSTLL